MSGVKRVNNGKNCVYTGTISLKQNITWNITPNTKPHISTLFFSLTPTHSLLQSLMWTLFHLAESFHQMTACVMGMNWSIPASRAWDMLFCLLCAQNYRDLPLLQLINPSQWHSALWEGLSFGTVWREVHIWPCQDLSGPINAHFTTAVENCFSTQQAEMMLTHAKHLL